ncbi:MAG: hypothetical protein IT198_08375 [Acidimicrobiia bacterium]|nr:hypothetical protein [Acidimicrobiia bacterium]
MTTVLVVMLAAVVVALALGFADQLTHRRRPRDIHPGGPPGVLFRPRAHERPPPPAPEPKLPGTAHFRPNGRITDTRICLITGLPAADCNCGDHDG